MKEENRKERSVSQAKDKKKYSFWIGMVFVAIVFAVGILFYVSRKSGEMPRTREKVTVGISKSFLSIPVYIAKEKGYFSKEGLDVVIKEYSSGKMATRGLFAGEVDISTAADMPVVFNSFKRHDFYIIATFAYSYHMVKIIARKDTGIKTGADLKGKKVGADRRTSSHFFLRVFLIHNQLSISDVEMIHIRTVDMPAALNNNEVDAISVWQPYAQKARQLLQDNAMELPGSEIYRTTFNFMVMKDFAKDRPDTAKRFLRALDRAATFIHDHREESQEIITEIFGLDEKTVRALWDDYVFGIFLDQSLLIGWEDIARWTIKTNLADKTKIPNYLDFIYSDILAAVKPEAISIIH